MHTNANIVDNKALGRTRNKHFPAPKTHDKITPGQRKRRANIKTREFTGNEEPKVEDGIEVENDDQYSDFEANP